MFRHQSRLHPRFKFSTDNAFQSDQKVSFLLRKRSLLLASVLIGFGATISVQAQTVTTTTGEPTFGLMVVTDTQVEITIDDPDAFADEVRDVSEAARDQAIIDFIAANPPAAGDPPLTEEDVPQSFIDTAVTAALQPVIDGATTGNNGDAQCAQQLDGAITGLDSTATGLSLGGNIASLIGNLTPPPGDQIGGVVGDGLGIASDAVSFASIGTAGVQNNLPNCNARFTGTIKADANILANQGISAFNGGIIIGNADNISYFEGITLGGGKLAGAGKGGLDALTGDKDAVAIGNGAEARFANDTAIGTKAKALGGNSTAIGANALAEAENSVALGADSKAKGKNSLAVGYLATAEKENDTALGENSNASGKESTAVGSKTNAEGLRSTALGFNAVATKESDTALGANSVASGLRSTAVGESANATGEDSLAIGSKSIAGGKNDVVVGTGNKTGTDGDNSILGNGNEILSGTKNIAIGVGHKITGDQNTVIGDPIVIDGQKNFIAGNNSTVFGDDNVVIGNENTLGDMSTDISNNIIVGDNNKNIITDNNNVVGDSNSISVGIGNNVFGDNSKIEGTRSLAIGQEVTVLDDNSVGIGAGVTISKGAIDAVATGKDSQIGENSKHSVVYGSKSIVANNAPESTVIGSNSKGNAEKTTVLGSNAEANAKGAAAFGYGARANLFDQQVFGTSKNTYSLRGITSDLSRSRQQGRLQLTTTDAFGNLASDGGDTFEAIANLQVGVAISMASQLPSLPGDKNFGFRIGYGNFDGEASAIAASAIGVLCRDCFTEGDRLTIDASFGFGWADFMAYESNEVVAGQLGISWVW